MSRSTLEAEHFVFLPKRYETASFGNGRINVGVIIQPNFASQTMNGCAIGCVQNAVQVNVGLVLQLH